MATKQTDRRTFLKSSLSTAAIAAAPLVLTARKGDAAQAAGATAQPAGEPRIRFAAIGMNHGHINGMCDSLVRGGGELVSFYAKEPDIAAAFGKRYPKAVLAKSEQEILDDKRVALVASAGIANERAPLGVRVMKAGKDYLSDKPSMTTLAQLAEVRKVQADTKRIFSVMYSERHENRATVKAGDLVKAGAIGKVIQTVGLGPHRELQGTAGRPDWFYVKAQYGGILTDIASHQFDQFLFFTNSTEAKVVASQVGNIRHPDKPGLEDFGDVMLRGNGGTGYIRVDWFTPKGLNTWGDGRLTILGTDGFIEIRKNVDIAGREGGSHLFLVDQKETRYVDCKDVPLPFAGKLVDDVVNRTETAMPQKHTFLAMQLALEAEASAHRLTPGTAPAGATPSSQG
ncbi:MAG: Gfo/Idh/MocA family oxidoreductase [Vicinamibacteraceae bacterium]